MDVIREFMNKYQLEENLWEDKKAFWMRATAYYDCIETRCIIIIIIKYLNKTFKQSSNTLLNETTWLLFLNLLNLHWKFGSKLKAFNFYINYRTIW